MAREYNTAERRLLPPRRTAGDRRVGERRLELVAPDAERRGRRERREGNRRALVRRKSEHGRREKVAVLVVSDEADDARGLRDVLGAAAPGEFTVSTATPQTSLDVLTRDSVDVVVLAMSFGDRRGFTTFTTLRSLAPAVPFIFLSEVADDRHGLEAVRAGAQDFLVRDDVDGDTLARALRHAIERGRLRAALLDLALVDDLTGLYNRRGFLTLAMRDLRLARRGGETLLVAFADLDDLKGINDSLGHAAGDRALRDAAAILRRAFRDSDLGARIGGDEYAVLVRHAGTDSETALADRLTRLVRDFNRRAARPYALSFSLGFASHQASTLDSVAGLLDRADRALYREKRRKREEE